jgi:hypothetical protein
MTCSESIPMAEDSAMTGLPPASLTKSATARATSGRVMAASSGLVTFATQLGLTKTFCPRRTTFPMPPSRLTPCPTAARISSYPGLGFVLAMLTWLFMVYPCLLSYPWNLRERIGLEIAFGKMTIRIRLRFVNDFGAFASISSLMPQTFWIASSEH